VRRRSCGALGTDARRKSHQKEQEGISSYASPFKELGSETGKALPNRGPTFQEGGVKTEKSASRLVSTTLNGHLGGGEKLTLSRTMEYKVGMPHVLFSGKYKNEVSWRTEGIIFNSEGQESGSRAFRLAQLSWNEKDVHRRGKGGRGTFRF